MIVSVSIVKNADDIIESFIRYNANCVDHFIIIHNDSCDQTLPILKSLQKEGYSIEIVHEPALDNRNAERIKRIVLYASQKYHPDFFLLLDCDEIVIPGSGCDLKESKKLIMNLPKDAITGVRWRLFFPPNGICEDIPDVTKRITSYYTSDNTRPFGKCIIPNKLVDGSLIISQGNHQVTGNKITTPKVLNRTIEYAHYPCRSIEQLKAKIILSRWAYLMRTGNTPDYGKHYTSHYEKLKHHMVFNPSTFMEFVHEYVRFPNNVVQSVFVQKEPFVGDNLEHHYTNHINFDALEYILPFAESIITEHHLLWNQLNKTK